MTWSFKLKSSASFSRCGEYRYSLSRVWNPEQPAALLIGLNPSTADARQNDPTIRRCIGLCQSWGFGGFRIVNLFAWRTPSPKELFKVDAPIGPSNLRCIKRAAKDADNIIAMWGNDGNRHSQAMILLKALGNPAVFCAGTTQIGAPRHLLYVKNGTPLQPWRKPCILSKTTAETRQQ